VETITSAKTRSPRPRECCSRRPLRLTTSTRGPDARPFNARQKTARAIPPAAGPRHLSLSTLRTVRDALTETMQTGLSAPRVPATSRRAGNRPAPDVNSPAETPQGAANPKSLKPPRKAVETDAAERYIAQWSTKERRRDQRTRPPATQAPASTTAERSTRPGEHNHRARSSCRANPNEPWGLDVAGPPAAAPPGTMLADPDINRARTRRAPGRPANEPRATSRCSRRAHPPEGKVKTANQTP